MSIRKLALDIETSPNLAWTFNLWNANIGHDHIVQPSRMICFAATWIGSDEVIFRSEFHNGPDQMVIDLWDLLNETDAVVHFNGERFDMPRVNAEFMQRGFGPPAPYKQIDIYKLLKRVVSFPSMKLAYLAPALGSGEKMKHSGFDLWIRCMNGDPEAWEEMKKYNIIDTKITAQTYLDVRPWLPGLPSEGAANGADVCPDCETAEFLVKEGFAITATGKYQRFNCSPISGGCGRWSRSSRRIEGTKIVSVSAAG